MRTATCTLTFRDGKTLIGSVRAETPQGSYTVNLTGEVGRLHERFESCCIPLLKSWFSNEAQLSAAQIETVEQGDYENWAL